MTETRTGPGMLVAALARRRRDHDGAQETRSGLGSASRAGGDPLTSLSGEVPSRFGALSLPGNLVMI